MPRYVVLTHDHPFPHWDLLLEAEESLRSWRLLERPERGKLVAAAPLPPHRKLYLDYEGPVSGDRGVVARCDAGTYETINESDDGLRVRLSGGNLAGLLVLESAGDGAWTARFVEET